MEYIEGKANVLADHVSRVPVQDVVGLADEAAFDLSDMELPTSGMYTALEEYRAEYNEQLAARACPVCKGREGSMVLCDRCGTAWHPGCAGLHSCHPGIGSVKTAWRSSALVRSETYVMTMNCLSTCTWG